MAQVGSGAWAFQVNGGRWFYFCRIKKMARDSWPRGGGGEIQKAWFQMGKV